MRKVKVILDTDPGIDDAISIFALSQARNIDIKLIVTSGGNLNVNQTTINARYLADRFGIKAQVVKGATKPLKRKSIITTTAHGTMGLGGFIFDDVKYKTNSRAGYIEEIKKIVDNNKEVVYLCIGPLTNIANFLIKYPTYAKKFKEIVFMGGDKDDVLAKEPYPEFNVLVDPESVQTVLDSKAKLTMIPMNLGHFAYFSKEDISRIARTNKLGKDFKKMFDQYKDGHVPMGNAATHDLCACIHIINNKFLKYVNSNLVVQYFQGTKKGVVINSNYSMNNKRRAKVAIDIDENKVKELFMRFLIEYKE